MRARGRYSATSPAPLTAEAPRTSRYAALAAPVHQGVTAWQRVEPDRVSAHPGRPPATGSRPGWLALAAILGYALLLVVARPATPFEWDEVLYQRALDRYDVAVHSPHPPGAPVFVALAKLARVVIGDPGVAIQLTAIAFALLALVMLVRLSRQLSLPPAAALSGAVLLAVTPAFAFHANVGLSDVPAAAGVLATLVLLCATAERPRRLVLAAAVAAATLGIRPQVAPALLPGAVLALASSIRASAWKTPLAALGAFTGVSAAIWLPAILLTGPVRYLGALREHARYVASIEAPLRLPQAPLGKLWQHWFVNPLGTTELAAAFLALALLGAAAAWRTGRRRLVGLMASTVLVYLGWAVCSMNMLTATRFAIPALAGLAVLAGGLLCVKGIWARATGAALLAAWCATALAWGMPAYVLRREPAPIWGALTWVRDHCDPKSTTVLFNPFFAPHAEYVLARAGFTITPKEDGRIYEPEALQPGGQVVAVLSNPVPGGEVLFERDWHAPKVLQLAFNRYGSGAATRLSSGPEPRYSLNWLATDRGWWLRGHGLVQIGADQQPLVATVCPLSGPLWIPRGDGTEREVAAGSCGEAAVRPGPAGTLTVKSPPGVFVLLRPVTLAPIPAR